MAFHHKSTHLRTVYVDTLTKYILPHHPASGAVVFGSIYCRTMRTDLNHNWFSLQFSDWRTRKGFYLYIHLWPNNRTSIIVIVSVSYFLVGKKLSASNDLFKQQTNGKMISLHRSDLFSSYSKLKEIN